MHAHVIVPPALSRGARVAVVAPSGPFDEAELLAGLRFLEERYELALDPGLSSELGYLAGSDERRRIELDRALRDREVAAIVVARGGYGLHRIAHTLDFSPLRRAPKWIIGFSDATVLHEAAWMQGVASLHAHNITGLGRAAPGARDAWRSALEEPRAPRRIGGLERVRGGRPEGPLVGGNLTVLFTSAAAGRLHFPDGALVVLEDVTEQAYRIDRMLTALEVGGHFDRAAAVLVGELTGCPASRGVSALDAARERLEKLGIPVVFGLPVGHGERNEPLLFGARARLDADLGLLELGALDDGPSNDSGG